MMVSIKVVGSIFCDVYILNIFLHYIFVEGLLVDHEVVERGKTQYHLLKEKTTLPQYGTCWKSAVEHLENGCRHLTENIQSDIALHITNCFLEMSGHATYNCELDKKANLRAICINSMSDRAFNVYTEFYTHTQNICWFLQGQIWHEMIAESTIKVGKQLRETALNQEGLLQAQKESYKLQIRMLQQGQLLEKVVEDIYVSFKEHQDVLKILSKTISNLQSWIVGEISWIDSIIFYTVSLLLIFLSTATQKTASARLPLLCILSVYFMIERYLCSSFVTSTLEHDAHIIFSDIYNHVWYSRYVFVFFASLILIYKAFSHKDVLTKYYDLLILIQDQNIRILNHLEDSTNSKTNLDKSGKKSMNRDTSHINYDEESKINYDMHSTSLDMDDFAKFDQYNFRKNIKSHEELCVINSKSDHLDYSQNERYNLRSNSKLR